MILLCFPFACGRLTREQLRSPSFNRDPRALCSDDFGTLIGEVSHDLPSNGGIRIEEPLEVRRARCVIL